MKPIITNFNAKTGDFEITIPIPFTPKDGIEYVGMMVADIPKYEYIKDYNVFDLIRENQKLKNQQKEFIEWLENEIEALEFCDNEFILSNHKKEVKAYKEILLKYKEIIGDDK